MNRGPETVVLKTSELVVLLYNLSVGNTMRDVGFEDAENELLDVIRGLDKPVHVNRKLVESALWSSNIMDENKLFWNPLRTSFKNFVNKIATFNKLKFNHRYNFFEENKDD